MYIIKVVDGNYDQINFMGKPYNEILVHIGFASHKFSGLPAQMCRLDRAFTAGIHKVWT